MDEVRITGKPERNQIKELRERLELTQERFAARLGVTVSTVNRWETGKGRPSPLARIRIDELWQKSREGR